MCDNLYYNYCFLVDNKVQTILSINYFNFYNFVIKQFKDQQIKLDNHTDFVI